MRTKRLRWWIAAGWIGAVGFLGGVVGSSDAAPKRGGELVFAQEAQVNGLDMHFSSAISTRNIAMHIYEALLTRDESNAPIADLAERWVASPDGLTYTFPLRKGVLFHNGKEMTSADVLASFQRYEKLGVDRKMLEQVASMSSPGDYKGEEVVLITNTDYQNMYNASLVMAEQLKALGMIVRVEVSDWPTVRKKQADKNYPWNFYFTGFGTGPAVGASGALLDLIPPTALQHTPGDPAFANSRPGRGLPDREDREIGPILARTGLREARSEGRAGDGRAQDLIGKTDREQFPVMVGGCVEGEANREPVGGQVGGHGQPREAGVARRVDVAEIGEERRDG